MLVLYTFTSIFLYPLPVIVNMTITKLEHFYAIFPKPMFQPVDHGFYIHAATASQPKPRLVIIGLSPVKSKIVDT